ncbi:dockerin type I domain-containing protein [Candidatus Methylobacter favarea]|nr:dockerin type I domain-containing protein [Candidatus Methylobacter favarea]
MTVLEHSTTKYNASVLICICLLLAGGFAGIAQAGINKWTAIGPEGGTVTTVAIDPVDPLTLYAGGYGGVFKSSNGGASWQAVTSGLPSDFGVSVLAIDPVDPLTLYAGGYGGVFKSSNGGASWQAVTSGLPSDFGVSVLAIDPVDPLTLYAGTAAVPFNRGKGVFKSTNGGASWQAVNSGLPVPLFSFVGAPVLIVSALTIDPVDPETLYAGTDKGVFKSSNGGDSWQAINSGLPLSRSFRVPALAIDPLDGATLYVGTNGNSVFKITFKTLGDINQDGDIDRSDLARITAALNQPADGPDDVRDLNGDLSIDALDARKLVLLCTQPQCAAPRPNR